MATRSTSTSAAPTGAFRITAYVEAATYLVLLAAVVLYRLLDGPDFISVLGPIHGVAFLVYLMLALRIRESQDWGLWDLVVVVVAAAVPFGGFWAGRHLKDEEPAEALG